MQDSASLTRPLWQQWPSPPSPPPSSPRLQHLSCFDLTSQKKEKEKNLTTVDSAGCVKWGWRRLGSVWNNSDIFLLLFADLTRGEQRGERENTHRGLGFEKVNEKGKKEKWSLSEQRDQIKMGRSAAARLSGLSTKEIRCPIITQTCL